MTETEILRGILARLGARPDLRLFRNSVGVARDPRTGAHIKFGLCNGSSDLIGWRVLPSGFVVKAPIAQFVALEVKSDKGQLTPEQRVFLEVAQRMGCFTGLVRSVDDAVAVLSEAPI